MRFVDEYRDPSLIEQLTRKIESLASAVAGPVTIMEICGSHTYAIARFGIKRILPANITLVSGPGCPVCVTSASDVETAFRLASMKGVVFATFGDMLRVPGKNAKTLQRLRAEGADVRVVGSSLEVMKIAQDNPRKEVVFMGIGFETTTPTVASLIKSCALKGVGNVSLFSVHKVIPPAIDVLLDDPGLRVDGFLCPGHVSTVIGYAGYAEIPRRQKAAVITGFEPLDIMQGIAMILQQILEKTFRIDNQYSRVVKPEGNIKALGVMNEVFKPAVSEWRGLGTIPLSGLELREEFGAFDAIRKLGVEREPPGTEEEKGCMCGSVLKGVMEPGACPLFGVACTPSTPVGPCMVSREGTCAAYYKCS